MVEQELAHRIEKLHELLATGAITQDEFVQYSWDALQRYYTEK